MVPEMGCGLTSSYALTLRSSSSSALLFRVATTSLRASLHAVTSVNDMAIPNDSSPYGALVVDYRNPFVTEPKPVAIRPRRWARTVARNCPRTVSVSSSVSSPESSSTSSSDISGRTSGYVGGNSNCRSSDTEF